MKLNRNTIPATEASVLNAKEKRKRVLSEIQEHVIEEFCECGTCLTGDLSAICISPSDIAGSCNVFKISTVRGKIGSWKPNMVTNIINKEGGSFVPAGKRAKLSS